MHIAKYKLFCLHNVMIMYVFRAQLLALDHQSVCSSLRKTFSPTLRTSQLFIILCIGLRQTTLYPFKGKYLEKLILITFNIGSSKSSVLIVRFLKYKETYTCINDEKQTNFHGSTTSKFFQNVILNSPVEVFMNPVNCI